MSAAELYLSAMESFGRAPETIRRGRITLRRVEKHIGRDLLTATGLEVETWLHSLDVLPASKRMYLNDVQAFYRWAVKRDLIDADPTARLDGFQRPKYLPRPMADEDLARAIALADTRMRRTLMLAALAGLRCVEISRLSWADVDLDNATLRVLGKGSKSRVIPLHPDLAAELAGGGVGPVVGWRGRHVSPRSISGRVANYLHGLGIDATAHMGRHWFGTNAYRGSQDIVAVAALMGHASVQTTQAYVQGSQAAMVAAVGGLSIGGAS